MVYLILIIIVVIFIMFYRARLIKSGEKYLLGFWNASKQFAYNAAVDEMMMFIGPEDPKKPGQRTAYLLLSLDGQPIYNNFIKMNVTRPEIVPGDNLLGTFKFGLNIRAEDIGVDLPIPDKLDAELDIISGQLKLFKKNKLYGMFYKDHQTTESVLNDYSSSD